MDKETIMNTYAIEQGYKNWSAILFQFQDDFNYASPEDENNVMNWIEHHISAVTDLIQEELKKKICDTLTLVHDMPYIEIKETINETEML